MKMLAIDTSLATGSVAAFADGRVASRSLSEPTMQARLLAAQAQEACAEAGFAPRDADLLAVVRGPGGFTGLRVGVATAKAWAWATGARLVGVSGFEVVASRAGSLADAPGAVVHVAFDAGRGEVFAAAVAATGAGPADWRVAPAVLLADAEWAASLPSGAAVSGPALARLAPLLASRPDLRLPPPEAWLPTAIDTGRVARARADAGLVDDPLTLVPDYMRPTYADERPA